MKHRDIPIYQLLEVLQKEYIICEIRAKIYPTNHKEYWKELMDRKKAKILDISKKNSLPNIFDSTKIKESFYQMCVPTFGMPFFYYPSKEREEKQKYYDMVNYYKKGQYFKYYDTSLKDNSVGVLIDINVENSSVILETKSQKQIELRFSDISRIL
jgi:hypothetical protein